MQAAIAQGYLTSYIQPTSPTLAFLADCPVAVGMESHWLSQDYDPLYPAWS